MDIPRFSQMGIHPNNHHYGFMLLVLMGRGRDRRHDEGGGVCCVSRCTYNEVI
jgi:hypothetical protein